MPRLGKILVFFSVCIVLYMFTFIDSLRELAAVDRLLMGARYSGGYILALYFVVLALYFRLSKTGNKSPSTSDQIYTKNSPVSWIRSRLIFIVLISICGIYVMGKFDHKGTVKKFNEIYFDSFIGRMSSGEANTYLGVPIQQYPTDCWIMREIINEVKPDYIIETGTGWGGSALFFASVLKNVNPNGKVLTVDINPRTELAEKNKLFGQMVEVIKSDSVAPDLISKLKERVRNQKVFVTLDSLHTYEHVKKELELYSDLVSVGSYLVVQDTYFYRHPNVNSIGHGPWKAMTEFLQEVDNFVIDKSVEVHFISQHESGFLKRIK